MNIILAGMPGSGKTTVAHALGKLVDAKIIDTDAEIVKRHGALNAIFQNYGEKTFRDIETETVKEVCGLSGVIVATGGGCLLREENVSLFKRSGKIVYLRTQLKTLINRVNGDTSRPLLKGSVEEKLTALYKVRESVYMAAADFTFDTDDRTPEEIANQILALLQK